jgi:hypothetical protein
MSQWPSDRDEAGLRIDDQVMVRARISLEIGGCPSDNRGSARLILSPVLGMTPEWGS